MSEYLQLSSPEKSRDKIEDVQEQEPMVTEHSAQMCEIFTAEHSSSMDYEDETPKQNHILKSDGMPQETDPRPQNSTTINESVASSSKQESGMFQPASDVPKINEIFSDKEISQSGDELRLDLVCRLCAVPCQGSSPIFLFRHPPHHPEILQKGSPGDHEEEVVEDVLAMIKATLPIKVSCCDKLPKQVCKLCVERLQLSHAFTTTVLKAESQLLSLRAQHKITELSNDAKSSSNAAAYDCPVCKETPVLLNNQSGIQPSYVEFQGENYAWESIVIKDEPEDEVEPSHEELEKSYHELFGGQKEDETFRMEEKITLKPSKPSGFGGRRPRGRPRTRPPKVTPRGRRGRRSTQTTVEKILELSRSSPDNDGYGFRICSREHNPATEALTQCLLCERWLPGAAACLQHSLVEHMDCGSFLCPRCPRDDFPGDFELIQHFQERHCPDLELYEVYQSEKNDKSAIDESQSQLNWQHVLEKRTEPQKVEKSMPQYSGEGESSSKIQGTSQEWNVETMEEESLHNNTLTNELDESQDEISSNLSEVAPRSLTSHSALYGEESNSISTPGSDSNMASEDILTAHISDQHVLHDELICRPSSLTDDVSLGGSPCALGVGDFASELNPREEACHNSDKGNDKGKIISCSEASKNECEGDLQSQGNDFKALQESQDSLEANELYGFQEAINEKSQEVSLNGSSMHFDSDTS